MPKRENRTPGDKTSVKSASKTHFVPLRGSVVRLNRSLDTALSLAVIVSNDVQNEMSSFVLVVPLERRISRLAAPFAVDLGRNDGLRNLHTARCDWLTRVRRSEISSVERGPLSTEVMAKIEHGLRVSLGLREVWQYRRLRKISD